MFLYVFFFLKWMIYFTLYYRMKNWFDKKWYYRLKKLSLESIPSIYSAIRFRFAPCPFFLNVADRQFAEAASFDVWVAAPARVPCAMWRLPRRFCPIRGSNGSCTSRYPVSSDRSSSVDVTSAWWIRNARPWRRRWAPSISPWRIWSVWACESCGQTRRPRPRMTLATHRRTRCREYRRDTSSARQPWRCVIWWGCWCWREAGKRLTRASTASITG